MLADNVNAFRSGMVYPDGYEHDRALDDLRQRLAASAIFVLNREAVAMAASVALSKPSTIISALPWVGLPYERMWIEFSGADLTRAMGELGSTNEWRDGAVRIEQAGFLLTNTSEGIAVEYVSSLRPAGHDSSVIDLAPVQGMFSLKGIDGDLAAGAQGIRQRPHKDITGRVRQFLLYSEDPHEVSANAHLAGRFSWADHPDMERVRKNVVAMVGSMKALEIVTGQATDMRRLFLMQILPTIILLNCRNAVDLEDVTVSKKLNKSRIAKGRKPLFEHKIVKLHLSPSQKRTGAASHGRGHVRGTMVMGHFKVRKSGIFWWSPHPRMGGGSPDSRRTIVSP